MDENYNTLKEMILDENRLVTYVSISKDLCIHINESKRLLHQIIEDVNKSHPEITLNVIYIISGLTEGNSALTTVTSEVDIASVKQSFKSIFFEHVYSVSKGSPSIDNVALMSVNKFEDFSLCTGLIKSNDCVKHSIAEISNLKSNSQVVAPIDSKLMSLHSKSKEVKNETSKVKSESSKNHVKGNETKEVTVKPEITSTKIDKKIISTKTTKGIAGFFNKSNGVATKNTRTDTTVVKQEKDGKSVKVVTREEPIEVKMEVDKEEPAQSKNKTTPRDSEKAKNKNLNIKKNAKVDKKRKRVLQVSDSESEDEKSDPFADSTPVNNQAFESDDEIPPTPIINTVKITSGMVNPKKKRKIVDKTYTDEDGYILTKKEEVYESCSDNEMEVDTKENNKHLNQVKVEVSPSKKQKVEVSPSKKQKVELSPSKKQNGTKNSKKKISPPQKGKQATLMSFFKKV